MATILALPRSSGLAWRDCWLCGQGGATTMTTQLWGSLVRVFLAELTERRNGATRLCWFCQRQCVRMDQLLNEVARIRDRLKERQTRTSRPARAKRPKPDEALSSPLKVEPGRVKPAEKQDGANSHLNSGDDEEHAGENQNYIGHKELCNDKEEEEKEERTNPSDQDAGSADVSSSPKTICCKFCEVSFELTPEDRHRSKGKCPHCLHPFDLFSSETKKRPYVRRITLFADNSVDCATCKRRFTHPRFLERHKCYKAFDCPFCQQTFQREADTSPIRFRMRRCNHLKYCRQAQQPLECARSCGKRFKSQSGHDRHAERPTCQRKKRQKVQKNAEIQVKGETEMAEVGGDPLASDGDGGGGDEAM